MYESTILVSGDDIGDDLYAAIVRDALVDGAEIVGPFTFLE